MQNGDVERNHIGRICINLFSLFESIFLLLMASFIIIILK